MLAYSADQEFYCINHCGPFLIVIAATIVLSGIVGALSYILSPFIVPLAPLGALGMYFLFLLIRRNIRMKYNIGTPNNWIGDCFMICCPFTSMCSFCQELRAIPVCFIFPFFLRRLTFIFYCFF